MAIGIGVAQKATGSAVSSITTAGGTTVTGSTIVAAFSDFNANVNFSDSKSNTYSQSGTDLTATTITGQVWYCENATGGAGHTVTATAGSGTFDGVLHSLEITGAAIASYDSPAQAQAIDTTVPFTVTSGTFAQANNLVIAFFMPAPTGTPTFSESSGFTVSTSETNASLYWCSALYTKIVSATTALTASFDDAFAGSGNREMLIAAFKESGGGGTNNAIFYLKA